MKALQLSILAVLAIFISGCFELTFDTGIYKRSPVYSSGYYGQQVARYQVFNCSSYPTGSEERAVCDEGLREREQQYLSNIYYHARDAGYGRGFNGLPDTRERYCSQYADTNRKEACESGYAGGFDDGRVYYLERIRERARRGQF